MSTVIESVTLALEPERGPVDVAVAHGTITSVAPAHHPGSTGRHRFLLPGLIDTHVHLTDRQNLVDLARAGVTTGVDLGTHPDSLIASLRELPGAASIVSAGCAASAPGGTQTTIMGFPVQSAVTGPEDAERFVSWRVDNGSDVIKIIIEDPRATPVPALSPETLHALVESAHTRGLLTVAHVVTSRAFELGLDAGVDILTHAPRDSALPDSTVRRMLQARTVASPTLVMMRTMLTARPTPGQSLEPCLDTVRALREAGVPVIAGTDANDTPVAPVPHGSSLHDELELLVQCGLSPRQALLATTHQAAAHMRLQDRGRISQGLRADLVLLDTDPVLDLSAARCPAAVWVAGAPVDLVR